MVHLFLDFELDPERFELRRDRQPVRVEPRVLEVLLYLVTNHGRIVTKQELIDRVWGGTIVSESALTRCIVEARRAIGDSTRDEPAIRTVHGRGYRFEAEVRVATREAAPEASLVVPEPAPAPLAIAETAPVSNPEPATAAMPEKMRWNRAALAALLAGILLAIAATRYGKTPEKKAETEVIRLALLPIAVNEEVPDLHLLAVSLGDLLEKRLMQIPRLVVQGADYSREPSLTEASLADVGKRTRASNLISGSLTMAPGGDKGHLVVTLHQIGEDGQVRDTPLGQYDLPLLRLSRDVRAYAAARDRIAEDVAATLRPAFSLQPASALTPRNPEAYRLYLLARQRLSEGSCDGEAAIELLRRSLELDGQFAPAWEALGWAQYGLSSSCVQGPAGYREALRAAERALALMPEYSSAIGLKAAVLAETGRIEEAYSMLQAAERQQPVSPDVQSFLFYVLGYAGYNDEAKRHLDKLLQLDPSYLTRRGWTPNPYLYLGETKRFLETLPGTEAPLFRYYRGLALAAANRSNEARQVLEPAFRLNPSDAFARLSEGLLAAIEGRTQDARVIVTTFARQRELVGGTDGEVTYKVAQLAALAGDRATALRELRRAVDQGFFSFPYIESDPLLASLRDDPEYQRIVALARSRHELFGRRFGLQPRVSSRGSRPGATSRSAS